MCILRQNAVTVTCQQHVEYACLVCKNRVTEYRPRPPASAGCIYGITVNTLVISHYISHTRLIAASQAAIVIDTPKSPPPAVACCTACAAAEKLPLFFQRGCPRSAAQTVHHCYKPSPRSESSAAPVRIPSATTTGHAIAATCANCSLVSRCVPNHTCANNVNHLKLHAYWHPASCA